jgi:Uma2 family endonuclease
MTTETRLMTADELSRLPRGRQRHELIRGVLRTMPLAFMEEGIVASNVTSALWKVDGERQIGEAFSALGFLLTTDPDTVRAPDVSFIRAERLEALKGLQGYVPGAPDLAVEVVSQTDLYLDVVDAVADWLEYGARLILVVNPRRQTVAVHRPGQPIRVLGMDDTLSGEDVVPGWSMAVRDLFDLS